MPTSAPGPCSRRGFTLLELLVVLLIMGLFAGLVAAISHPDERALLRVEAERLAQLLDLAAAESQLTGRPTAWTADGAQYRFWRWRDDTGWTEAREDALRARSLPPGMATFEEQVGVRRLREDAEWRRIAAFPANTVDPTGAGDIFAASFFIHLYETEDPWAAARFAIQMAAIAISREGLAGVPEPEEVALCRMRAG